ncbi:MAG: type II secretion system F family protein [Anaerolineae bacterium]|jgi:tight adherence protein B
MQVAFLVAIAIVLSISATAWVIWRLARGQSGVIQDRLEAYAARGGADVVQVRQRRTIAAQLDQMLRKRAYGRRLAEELARADLQLRVSEFVVLSLLSAVMSALLALLVFAMPALAVVAAFAGFFLPRIYLRRRQAARLKAFGEQLGDALGLLVSSLRSGYSMLQSMEVVASELPEPIAGEFGRVVREVGLGLSQEQAFINMLNRVPSEDLDMMVTAINVQHEVGGNLAEILDTISGTSSERVRIQGEIRVLTAQQMLSGYMLTCLPVAVTLILFAINRPYMSQLFTDTCGLVMVAIGVLMTGSGFLIIRRIVKIEV